MDWVLQAINVHVHVNYSSVTLHYCNEGSVCVFVIGWPALRNRLMQHLVLSAVGILVPVCMDIAMVYTSPINTRTLHTIIQVFSVFKLGPYKCYNYISDVRCVCF